LSKIYVEVSDLLEHLLVGKALTGISRVILHSLSGFVSEFGEESVRLLAYDSLSNKMREKSANLLAPLYGNPVGKRLFAKNPLGLSLICQFWNEAAPSPEDILFHAGNWWWRPAALQAFEKLKLATGSRACFFIHDLIPIAKPEFVAIDHVEKFKSGFRNVARISELIITSSKSAHDDILRHLEKIGMPDKALQKVPLADEFAPMPRLGFHPIHALANLVNMPKQHRAFVKFMANTKTRSFVLMVGTIENRKNVLLVLKTWESLALKLGDALPQLLLVGKWGQGAAEMQSLLTSSQNISGRVHVLNRVSDLQLEQLYQACQFTIFMSHYEGWGLPIGESLWFGKEVLVPKDFALRPDMSNLNGSENKVNSNIIDEITIALGARKLIPPKLNELRSLVQFQHDISKRISILQN
jgi:glycosyltransferase involved in cell wall biosynthesis